MADQALWNLGWEAFNEGQPNHSPELQSRDFNEGYAAAKEAQRLELEQAERDCIDDYDKGPGA